MSAQQTKSASTSKVVVAFATVYLVWGSTYFFIRLAVEHIPPMMVGCLRYLMSGLIMLGYCVAAGEKVFVWKTIRPALISGCLLLFLGNGALIWAEQYVASSLAAILLASGPIWFVLMDKRKWKENFGSRETLIGLGVGFIGVVLLFGERLMKAVSGLGGNGGNLQVISLFVVLFGAVAWTAGSLYAKYNSAPGSANSVNAGWQMLAAGLAFLPVSVITGEFSSFNWHEVSTLSWLSVFYLVVMGSLAGYSAFVWLLQVRSATQVSTHAYVNPVVAVLLGVFFANEHMTAFQLLGLAIILVSVLLINLAKYRAAAAQKAEERGAFDMKGTVAAKAR